MTSRGAWADVLAAAAVGAGELGAAIGLHVWFEGLPYDERPIPVLDAAPWILVGLACFTLMFSGLRVWQRRREPRLVGAVAMLVGHLVLTGAGAVGVLFSDPDFLFGPSLDDSLELPDGNTAYLYRGGLFCSYDVFIATPDDLLAYKAQSISAQSCATEPGKLVLEGRRIVVVDEHGAPLPASSTDWGELLFWAPH